MFRNCTPFFRTGFQIENFRLKSSSNSSSKPIQHTDDLSGKNLDNFFYARFVYGKLQDLMVDQVAIFTNLCLGRKVPGEIFILKFRTQKSPKNHWQ
jgi:hypothetical protein